MKDLDQIETKLRLLEQQGFKKSAVLERELDVSGSTIRDVVRDMRRRGIPIISDSRGYGYAKSINEIIPTLKHLKARALSELKTIRKLERNFVNPNSQDSLFYTSPIDELMDELKKI